MVKTRNATDSHGNISSEMPVRETTSAADKIGSDPEVSNTEMPKRRYSDPMDGVRNVRRKESRDRELRNRVVIDNGSSRVIGNGNRSSTRIQTRPDRYRPSSNKRSSLMRPLRPRSAGHMDYLRRMAHDDGVDSVSGEDVGSDGGTDDDIFTPPVNSRRQVRALSSSGHSHSSQPTVSFARTTSMSNGHSSQVLDDSHEGEGVRRSTRQRKLTYDNFNQSWILGTQTVRGYRMREKDQTEEEEEEEEEEEDSEEEEGAGEVEGGEEREEAQAGSGDEGEEPEVKKEAPEQEDNEATEKENFEDMYSRVKRPRRTRQTIMFTEVRNTRSRSRKQLAGESSEEEAHSSDVGAQRPQSPRRGTTYHLRQRKPKVQHFQIEEPLRRAAMSLLRSPVRRKRSRRPRFTCSASSGSSSDSEYERKKGRNRNRCLPVNFASDLAAKVSRGEPGIKPVTGSNLADTDPMELDPSVRFSHVGGLDEHIRCLKEMVVFPMLYPEVFEKFHVQPPKGVLFHGPPGTGKTLLARALANECSQGTRRVAFFMRKGADCLSKWVGESERQLRLLFDQAYQMRPSIIFFDELDGLAPVRSCKQDQIHASIVSTLLALMDGLKNRGDVLLIGATNRIDAIDPALRRPGRFDRELFFPLPAVKERQDILQIHMSAWEQAPPPGLVSHLAEMASGYCGSDLRALCTEAVIQGLRRRYPQIYESTEKLMLDAGQVTVEKCDFQRARLGIVPAAHRVACAPARRLPPLVRPLLDGALNRVINKLKLSFPHANLKSSFKCKLLPAPVPHPRLVLAGTEQQGHVAHIAPALLHHMEHVSVHSLELAALFGTPGTTPEEVCVQAFQEARRQLPSVIYVPEIESWWSLVPQTVQALLTSKLASLEPGTAILLLASANCEFEELPQEVQKLFSEYRGEVLTMENASRAEREDFLRPVIITKPLLPPVAAHSNKTERLEPLPLAPPPEPPKLTETQEQELYKKEEMTLRELRIFLREICAKLARNKQFFMFVQPVDLEEAPDYLNIIKDPMDLETIMSKIDRHEYACAADFLADVDLVCRNALEYNPDRSNQGKMIRHRACYLHDTAHALIKAEMDSDFEDQCKNISQNRKKRAFRANKLAPDFVYTAPVKENLQSIAENGGAKEDHQASPSTSKAANGSATTSMVQDNEGSPRKTSLPLTPGSSADGKHKKRRSPWSRGLLPPRKKKRNPDDKEGTSPGTDGRQSPGEEEDTLLSASEDVNHKSPDKSIVAAVDSAPSTPIPDVDEAELMEDAMDIIDNDSSPAENSQETDKKVVVDQTRLEAVLTRALTLTKDLPLTPLLDLHAQLTRIVHTHSGHLDRSTLPQELEDELSRFARLFCIEQGRSPKSSEGGVLP